MESSEKREKIKLFIKEIMRRIVGEEREIVRTDEIKGEAGRWGEAKRCY